jgi:DNA (cytosine-5)-methyltransferase 1
MRTRISKITDYSEFLNDAWSDHQSGLICDAPTVISTFSGIGGSTLGYSMAGFNELLAIEWDDLAVETFRANFPLTYVMHRDIGECSVDQVLDYTSLAVGALDLLDGSPPCQGFSTAGKRDLYDGRNQLFLEFVRLLNGLQPRAFIMENVSGLVKGKMKLVFVEILAALKDAGYRVSARLLNSKYFGVPQSRQRLIFIGIRNDLDVEPTHPAPKYRPVSAGLAVRGADTSGTPPFTDKNAQMWDFIPPGKSIAHVTGGRAGWGNCLKVDPLKPAPTIPSMQTGRGFATVTHWSERRGLSIGEVKRLQSFPDQFITCGDYIEQWAGIGNSVPPLMMREIAFHLRELVLG